MHYFLLLSAWFIFALWGVIAREIILPIPILLSIVTLFGFITTLFWKKENLVIIEKTAIIVSIILVLDLLFLLFAFRHINFATVITLHYFGPVIVTLLAPYILKEKISRTDIILAIIGFFGVFILFANELTFNNSFDVIMGLIAALLSSFTLAGNILYQRLYMKQQQDFIMAVRQYNLFMSLIFIFLITPIWFVFWNTDSYHLLINAITFKNIIALILAGIIVQGIAMILFNSSARFISGKNIAKMSYSEIVWVILFGVIIYNEHLSILQIIGILLILIVNYKGLKND